jgi:hypothetical protein
MSASRILALAALLVASATAAEAQVGTQSNAATVALTATKAATLTLSAVTPTASIASITDNSSANNFSAVSVTTDWNLTAGSTVNLVGWFAVPGSALANGTSLIPSSRVEGKIGAGAFTPFNGAVVGASGVAGGSLTFFSQALGALQGNRTDQLDLRLNLVGFGTTVAGDYTGTLNLQAIVQ